ncbi:MAG: hypothetical protein SAL70_18405 [Scytonema sp. PMC 1070.18]|nr:hypothetical protein [Scytonema sp. PMC 1070.18]
MIKTINNFQIKNSNYPSCGTGVPPVSIEQLPPVSIEQLPPVSIEQLPPVSIEQLPIQFG